MITLIHILIAVILFFLINLIGRYAPLDLKYNQISSFIETDEAPAFNFTFRVLTPIVVIIIISAVLYNLNLDRYVHNIYLVSVYYVSFRMIFNLLIGRFFLINWSKQIIYAFFIIGLTYIVYKKIIVHKENLLPDFSNIANELWIIIIVFIFTFINQIPFSDFKSNNRKHHYIKTVLRNIQNRYSEIVTSQTKKNIRLEQIIYAIIIYENFNRPKAFRIIEYISNNFSSKSRTYGIMQVNSKEPISDLESVQEGTRIIVDNFSSLIPEYKKKRTERKKEENLNSINYVDHELQNKLIKSYNPSNYYISEIIDLANYLNKNFYQNKEGDTLLFNKINDSVK